MSTAEQTTTRLTCIVMDRMGLNPVGQYRYLKEMQRMHFDVVKTSYIKELPTEDWEKYIESDFNTLMLTKVLSRNPASHIIDRVIHEKEVIQPGSIQNE